MVNILTSLMNQVEGYRISTGDVTNFTVCASSAYVETL